MYCKLLTKFHVKYDERIQKVLPEGVQLSHLFLVNEGWKVTA